MIEITLITHITRSPSERVTVSAPLRGEADGTQFEIVGPLNATRGGRRIDLSSIELLRAEARLEEGFLKCLGLTWADRRAT